MMSIASSDLDNMNCYRAGTYGMIYQLNDDTAMKIYKKLILADDGNYYLNPVLSRKLSNYQYMIQKGKNIKYSDLLRDVVSVDGQILGVLIPFYDGKTFASYCVSSFDFKYDLAQELIRNAEELTNHFIYPTDYKLNNLMVFNNHAKIIDLDDTCTKYCHIPHPFYFKESMQTLNETIQDFFDVHPLKGYSAFLKKELEVGFFPYCSSYSKLSNALKELGTKNDYCVVSNDSDSDSLSSLPRNFKFLYKTPSFIMGDDYYYHIIEEFRENGYSLYDFVTDKDIIFFPSNHAVSNLLELKGKTLIKK